MNQEHLELCAGEHWAQHLREEVLPWMLEGVRPSGDLLEIGPGPGAATDVLRELVPSLTALEYDPDLAARLSERFAGDPRVRVRHGDATNPPFADGTFAGAASLTMLHHIPSAALQDRLFGEVVRVLRPGGVFFGTDSLDGPGFRRLHAGDVCTPLDPLTLDRRLRSAGFAEVEIAVLAIGVRFVARTPGTSTP